MTDLDIAAPLAAALEAKGFDSLTPVQRAVLAAEAAGRDVLVSAQTGSGKTVAFGLAMAPEILGGAGRLEAAAAPLALAIAPTRELALQVARELGWLYGEAGALIATCVGGMDYRNERRALERGAHVVVGTPGRLRDHIERGDLNLSALRACVLDEADEMLDLGFREDLEFILEAAPRGRRTLMFSATVPAGIATLAKTFQRDALRIETAGEARQHADIAYRAVTVAPRDREPAIFNLLRYYEAPAAIVFCKTRANVNHLLARMGNRNFQVVALSGELSQQERTHALQALRDGRARVCIATDVAARGIDLPGLDLVIHADLPTNSETLLHRSGRTGRAGGKGVSALIVTPGDFRKAQRLLQGAQVEADWGDAPSADAVNARDDARIMEHPALAEAAGDEAALSATLLERFGAERVAAAFVRLWRGERSAPEELSGTRPPAPTAPRDRPAFGESVWFSISVGHEDRAEARWLLPKICEAGEITKDAVGAIRVRQKETFVQIAKDAAEKFGTGGEFEDGMRMSRLEGEPVLDRDARAPGQRPAQRPAPLSGPRPGAAAAPRPGRAGPPGGDRDGESRPRPAPDGEAAARRPRTAPAEGPAPPRPRAAKPRDGEAARGPKGARPFDKPGPKPRPKPDGKPGKPKG
ncbi:DEAD/DEAH box helicase [Rubrimonas cliftonensis]|uniref:ATP-dependent RNA helicase DeaD n=1 Tax=Rubrimonas cliftonensis TaxID=89524 RepID=A0A1H3XLY2_9RHOB|nr:DEAD/DEAH box helicase [Rubrimonas cliftonensis]SDZ99558.1 ATP-dependent RNA helicase DeaD [Rubrimonas cliftonensis]